MGDWQSGNLGRLNAAIQAQAEAGRIKESKKNRLASIAEGLTNNLFKRQSETAQQKHEIKVQKLLYGENVEPTTKEITTTVPPDVSKIPSTFSDRPTGTLSASTPIPSKGVITVPPEKKPVQNIETLLNLMNVDKSKLPPQNPLEMKVGIPSTEGLVNTYEEPGIARQPADYNSFMRQLATRTETVPDQPGGYKPGIMTGSTMSVDTNRANLDAASRSRSYEEYKATCKRMGIIPTMTEKDWYLGWPPRYGDSVDKEKGVGDLWTVLNITSDQLGNQNSPAVTGDAKDGYKPDTTRDKEVYKKQVLGLIHKRKGDDEVTTYLAKTYPAKGGGIDWKAADAELSGLIDSAWENATPAASDDPNALQAMKDEVNNMNMTAKNSYDKLTDAQKKTVDSELKKKGKTDLDIAGIHMREYLMPGRESFWGNNADQLKKFKQDVQNYLDIINSIGGKTYTDVLNGIKGTKEPTTYGPYEYNPR